MFHLSHPKRSLRALGKLICLTLAISAASIAVLGFRGEDSKPTASYRVLPPVVEDNLTVFPVVADRVWDTHGFLTLDEGIRSGEAVVAEEGSAHGLVRPRHPDNPRGTLEFPTHPPAQQAQVNQLVLENNSDRPLLLLAGEIVTGGKQDRVVGKDRIVAPHADPVELGVFCVEPHRWTGPSPRFIPMSGLMAQPSVRVQAMAEKNQQGVWNEVARAKVSVAAAAPPLQADALQSTSSLAVTMRNSYVEEKVASVAAPIERSYDKLARELKSQKAVGAVVAVNGELIWVDVFASQPLLEKYWPKLIRSYAAEAIATRSPRMKPINVTTAEAQAFLDNRSARRETSEREPGVYRNTEITAPDFTAFVLSSLLPGMNFDVHLAKMKK
jgi:hypothetical protein